MDSVALWIGHHWSTADISYETRPHTDVQDHAEHRKPRTLHQRNTYEDIQRLPQDKLWSWSQVDSIQIKHGK